MTTERDKWNQRYEAGSHSSMTPDPFLVRAWESFISPLFPTGGRALDVAGGIGRHAIFLAKRNWHVTMIDISEEGIAQARRNAGKLEAQIDFHIVDMKVASSREELGHEKYDLVLVFYYLDREIFPALLQTLAPHGLLIYKTYTVDQIKFGDGPSHPMHLLKENELLHSFQQLRILHYKETIHDRGVAELVGRKY